MISSSDGSPADSLDGFSIYQYATDAPAGMLHGSIDLYLQAHHAILQSYNKVFLPYFHDFPSSPYNASSISFPIGFSAEKPKLVLFNKADDNIGFSSFFSNMYNLCPFISMYLSNTGKYIKKTLYNCTILF